MPAMRNMHPPAKLLSSLLLTYFTCTSSLAQATEVTVSHDSQQLYKLDTNGNRLPSDSHQWECVEDETNNLFWQKRDPSGSLHDTNERYSWYQTNHHNSGQPRQTTVLPGFGASCYGYKSDDPSTFCNTDAFINRVNQSNYCGYSDWRLPTVTELLSLASHQDSEQPASSKVNIDYFPYHDLFVYWTDSVDEDGVVLTVIQDNKVLNNSERDDHILVRLVRG